MSTQLALLLSSPVAVFVLLVILDTVLGAALAVKNKVFDPHHLDNFLETQFGIQKGVGIAISVGLAMLSAVVDQGYKGAFALGMAQLIIACGAASVSVLGDIVTKVQALSGSQSALINSFTKSSIYSNNIVGWNLEEKTRPEGTIPPGTGTLPPVK